MRRLGSDYGRVAELMALPVQIVGANFPTNNGYLGPFQYGANTYFFDVTGTTVRAWKNTDPDTQNFVEQDSANRPASGGATIASMSAQPSVNNPTHVGLVFQALDETPYYARFDTSTDAWVDFGGGSRTVPLTIIGNRGTAFASVDICIHTGGNPAVIFNGDVYRSMGQNFGAVYFSSSSADGATWSAPTKVHADAAADHIAGMILNGDASTVHLHWAQGSTYHQRSVTVGDVLQTLRSDANSVLNVNYPFVKSPRFTRTTTQITCGYVDNNSDVTHRHYESSADPALGTPVVVQAGTTAAQRQSFIADGGTLYALYSESAGDTALKLEDDGGSYTWSGPVTELVATDTPRVSANVYTRAAKVIGYLYETGGNVFYDEYVLAAAGPTGTIAQNLPVLGQNGAGALAFVAAANQDLPILGQAAAGNQQLIGTIVQQAPALKQSATGVQGVVSGIADQSLAAIAQSVLGQQTFSGTVSQTLSILTQDTQGNLVLTGTASQILPLLTQDAQGNLVLTGTADQVLFAIEQAAMGMQGLGVVGMAAQDLPAVIQDASGVLSFAGDGAQILPILAQDATGAILFTSIAAQDLPAIEQSAIGATGAVIGSAVQDLPALTQASTGSLVFIGISGQMIPMIVQSAEGAVPYSGPIAQILPMLWQEAEGLTPYTEGPVYDQDINALDLTGNPSKLDTDRQISALPSSRSIQK